MTSLLTPGVRFLAITIPKVIAPPILVQTALQYLGPKLFGASFHLTRSLIICIWLFTLPLFSYLRGQYTYWKYQRDAERMGAELPPFIQGKLPWNIDLIYYNFFRKDMYLGDGFARGVDSHGITFANNVLGEIRIVTINPQHYKQVLSTEFPKYEKGPKFNKVAESVLGVGVFNSDGDLWQFHRKLTRPFFAKERVTDFGIFEKKTHLALNRMRERFDQGQAIDFQDICSRFTLDSACEFLVGTPIYSLRDPLPLPSQNQFPTGTEVAAFDTPSNRFAKAFADAQTSLARRARLGVLWPLFEIFKDRTTDDMRVVRGLIEPIVKEKMESRKSGGANGMYMSPTNQDSLLDHLLGVTQDMKLIVDEIINIMLAGRDTTAGLLTFVTYCLAMHPDVLARLREEILSTVGATRAPTFDDVREMKYLRAVLNETLRIFPSVPFNSKFSIEATTLDGENGKKYYIPPNTRVSYPHILTQRHKPYWGEDADKFDPDRFLDERVKTYLTPNPFLFVPFNAGPRICLGQQFAYHEASFFIIRMLQRFDRIELAPDCQPAYSLPPESWKTEEGGTPRKKVERCVLASHLTMYVEGGLWVRMSSSSTTEGV